jgi:hypothetical protein
MQPKVLGINVKQIKREEDNGGCAVIVRRGLQPYGTKLTSV